MPTSELQTLIAESRALRAELRIHLDTRKALARSYWSKLGGRRDRAVGIAERRVLQMTSLLLEAHQIARRDEDGLTIDVITDALEHLNQRLEREVLPYIE